MILLNTTFCVDNNICPDFIEFMTGEYIPRAVKAGIISPVLSQLRMPSEKNMLTNQPTRTLAMQMRAPSQEIADNVKENILPALYGEIGRRWGNAAAFFESTLDIIHAPRI